MMQKIKVTKLDLKKFVEHLHIHVKYLISTHINVGI